MSDRDLKIRELEKEISDIRKILPIAAFIEVGMGNFKQQNQDLINALKVLRDACDHVRSKREASCVRMGCTCCYDTAHISLQSKEFKKVEHLL